MIYRLNLTHHPVTIPLAALSLVFEYSVMYRLGWGREEEEGTGGAAAGVVVVVGVGRGRRECVWERDRVEGKGVRLRGVGILLLFTALFPHKNTTLIPNPGDYVIYGNGKLILVLTSPSLLIRVAGPRFLCFLLLFCFVLLWLPPSFFSSCYAFVCLFPLLSLSSLHFLFS